MFFDGYLFFGAILKFSRRKNRKTTSSQEGINQSVVVLPIQLVSFLLLSFPFLFQDTLRQLYAGFISHIMHNILSRPSKRKSSYDALRYKGRVLKSTHGTNNWDDLCLYWIIPDEMPKGRNLECFLMGTFFSVPFLNSRGGRIERLRPHRRVSIRVWWFFLSS